ncbi:uncharacterized protein LODBEIA_P05770 [Lodderomyces beijingensis]|uniref:ATPase expression protein 1 n=1 Tax=Lodderomyces beijingensis TaxID=1775926 RepID=A0ABP0ZDW2_9ASCO
MNLVRQATALKDIFVLEKPINSFIRRVGSEQLQNSGSLLTCIDGLINTHQELLVDKFKLTPVHDKYEMRERIWDSLKRDKIDKDLQSKARHKFTPQDIQFTPSYNKFIKELYPLSKDKHPFRSKEVIFDLKTNHDKYLDIDHEKLYRRYLDLPRPAPRYLPPQVLHDFIAKFALRNRRFANRNVVTGCKLKGNFKGAVRGIAAENERRRDYRGMVLNVFNDLKNAGLEITAQEQARIVYLSYFKDDYDVLEGIAVKDDESELGYDNKFTFDEYKSILETVGERSDIYGVLLLLAIRHDRFAIIEDILPKVQLGDIIENKMDDDDDGDDCKRLSEFSLSDASLLHLCKYFVHYINRPNYSTYLANTLQKINQLPVINEKIVDHVIAMLVNLGLIKHAEILFETAYFKAQGEEGDVTQEWLYVYTRLKTTTTTTTVDAATRTFFYKFSPTYASFSSLFRGYAETQQPWPRVRQLMSILDQLSNQFMSTEMYLELIKGFINETTNVWGLQDFVYLLTRLLVDIDQGTRHYDQFNLKEMISKSVVSVDVELELLMAEFESPIRANPNLRLSELLMEAIFMACERQSCQSKIPSSKRIDSPPSTRRCYLKL